MKTFRLNTPDSRCPTCAKPMNGAAALGHDQQPIPGDFSVCAYCGTLLRYGDALGVREVTKPELEGMDRGTRRTLLHHQRLAHRHPLPLPRGPRVRA